ncbi:hypothetical protein BJV77DRAFT_1013465 [Russula vinacea]|nr:hypothetical protein BJV77DRAFT_1013465 [Russula vinacea]
MRILLLSPLLHLISVPCLGRVPRDCLLFPMLVARFDEILNDHAHTNMHSTALPTHDFFFRRGPQVRLVSLVS